MKPVRILFLGASRLVGLMERFKMAAAAESVDVELWSVEENEPWHAIAAAGLCRVVAGPRFSDAQFKPFLFELVQREQIAVVIPNIDPATVALGKLKAELQRAGVYAVVSEPALCEAMNDKREADVLFRRYQLPLPTASGWPRLAKPRVGASSRGQVVFRDAEEFDFWAARNRIEDYVVQLLLRGSEYSVDAFVGSEGRSLGAVSRVRIVVSGGEVMVAKTDRNEAVLALADQVIAIPGWHGPINIQVMLTPAGPFLIEVNPRFSSGHTCAIEAGLDSPRWIIRKSLGRQLPERPLEWRSGLYMTRSRKDYFLWLS